MEATTFFEHLVGNLGVPTFLAAFIFAIAGVAISLLISSTTRDPLKDRTPIAWSWQFFWTDNVPRILKSVALTILIVFVSIRFMTDLLGQFSMFYSLLVGLGLDSIKVLIMKKRDKAMKAALGEPDTP